MLTETFLSLGLLVPVSALSLRIFFDAFRFVYTLQQRYQRIEIIQKIHWELMKNSQNLSFLNGNLCIFLSNLLI